MPKRMPLPSLTQPVQLIAPSRRFIFPLWSVFSPYQARSYQWSAITPTTGKYYGNVCSDMAMEAKWFNFGKQSLCFIGHFSPFLRGSSGLKLCSLSNYYQPEATSSGKVYFTQVCFSLGRAARQKDYLQYLFCIKTKYPNWQFPSGRCSPLDL